MENISLDDLLYTNTIETESKINNEDIAKKVDKRINVLDAPGRDEIPLSIREKRTIINIDSIA